MRERQFPKDFIQHTLSVKSKATKIKHRVSYTFICDREVVKLVQTHKFSTGVIKCITLKKFSNFTDEETERSQDLPDVTKPIRNRAQH